MPDQTDRFALFTQVLGDAITRPRFPGCAFGVCAGGEVILKDALGRFHLRRRLPVESPRTVFDVASISKVVSTTAVAMLLYQRGILDLDTPLGRTLPGFVVGRIRPPRDASHPPSSAGTQLGPTRPMSSLPHGLNSHGTLPRLPRTAHRGNPGAQRIFDPGFILLGKALEVSPRKNWLQRRRGDFRASRPRLLPASHPTSDSAPDSAHRDRQPVSPPAYTGRGAGRECIDPPWHRWPCGPASPMCQTCCASHAKSLLDHRTRPRQKVLPLFTRDTVECFALRQGPEGSSRALGWDTPSQESSAGHHFSPNSIGHLGFSGCSLWIDLDASIAAVLLSNRTWPDRRISVD